MIVTRVASWFGAAAPWVWQARVTPLRFLGLTVRFRWWEFVVGWRTDFKAYSLAGPSR